MSEWIKSPVGGTFFRYENGTKFVKFPAIPHLNIAELIITFSGIEDGSAL